MQKAVSTIPERTALVPSIEPPADINAQLAVCLFS